MSQEDPKRVPVAKPATCTCVITQEGDEVEVQHDKESGETRYMAPCCTPDGTDNKGNPCKQERVRMPSM